MDEVTLGWDPPSTGNPEGYFVNVSTNGDPEVLAEIVADPRVTLRGNFGDTMVVSVRAVGLDASGQSWTASFASPPSPKIWFLPALSWPHSRAVLALHCSTCGALQLRQLQGQTSPVESPSYPAPWRLVGVDSILPGPSLEALWQNQATGELHVNGLSRLPGSPAASTTALAPGDALAVTEINGDATGEIVVRDVAGTSLEFWQPTGGTITRVGSVPATPLWRFAGAEDFDGDGLSEIWWQTDMPGEFAVWKVDLSGSVHVLAHVDTPADGEIVAVADFDGDRVPETLWRDSAGRLTITYLTLEDRPRFAELEELPHQQGDETLQVRSTAELDSNPGAEILVQDQLTLRVTAILPMGRPIPQRTAVFDVERRFELVYAE